MSLWSDLNQVDLLRLSNNMWMNLKNMYRNMSLILSVPAENPAWYVGNLNNRRFPEKKKVSIWNQSTVEFLERNHIFFGVSHFHLLHGLTLNKIICGMYVCVCVCNLCVDLDIMETFRWNKSTTHKWLASLNLRKNVACLVNDERQRTINAIVFACYSLWISKKCHNIYPHHSLVLKKSQFWGFFFFCNLFFWLVINSFSFAFVMLSLISFTSQKEMTVCLYPMLE